MTEFDTRLTPARADVAAKHLEGRVSAQRFVEGARAQVIAHRTTIQKTPDDDARRESELLFGEVFTIYDRADGWAWGQAQTDDYVGYVRETDLADVIHEPTHRVVVARTFRFSRADLKSEPRSVLSLSTPVAVTEPGERWIGIERGGYIYAPHLRPLDEPAADWVAECEHFMGAPYLWGGRSAEGLDCSALIQLGLAMTGVRAPRDSDLQEAALGSIIDPADGLRRGDLVFWKGHVGVMLDAERVLHANAFHMATAFEPVDGAIRRIERTAGSVTSYKRL
jgi:cell wall-associated NlpC family hydrolase